MPTAIYIHDSTKAKIVAISNHEDRSQVTIVDRIVDAYIAANSIPMPPATAAEADAPRRGRKPSLAKS